jgi:hypothetical protein
VIFSSAREEQVAAAEPSVTRPLQAPSREEISPEALGAYDAVVARLMRMAPDGRMLTGYFGALLHSPEFAAAISHWGTLIRGTCEQSDSYSHADREFVDIILTIDSGYGVWLVIHSPSAVAAGVRLEAIEALREGREDDLTDDERQLVDYVRKVVSHSMTDETFGAMVARIGRRGTIEFTAFIANLYASLLMHQSFGVPAPSEQEVDQLLAGLRAGTVPLPSAAALAT